MTLKKPHLGGEAILGCKIVLIQPRQKDASRFIHDLVPNGYQPEVRRIPEESDSGVLKPVNDLDAVVGAVVVEEQELPVEVVLIENGPDRFNEVISTVVYGHADGDSR